MLSTKRAGHYKEPRSQSKLVQPVTDVEGGSTRLSYQVTIGFEFSSDWMKKWRELFKPIVYDIQKFTWAHWLTFSVNKQTDT